MPNKRILIFSIAYHPIVGGAEVAVRNITDRLLSYEFDLISCRFGNHPRQEKIGNVNVYRVSSGSRIGKYLYPLFAYRLAAELHRERPYEIVWAIMAAFASGAAMLFLRKFPKVKFLLTLQEGDPIEYIHERVRWFSSAWQKIFKRADYIQAISNFLADWAKKEGAVCPVEVVPNGVDFKNFQFSISNFQSKSKDPIYKIITTSRLVHKNGIDILIRACAKLQVTSYKLQVFGSGPDEAKLKSLAKELDIADCVEFFGHVEPDDLPKYYADADIFVRPSRSEGLGNSFLEAMAAGVPVIGTPVGGIPDFLIDGETGLFCRPEDPEDLAEKIQRLTADEQLQQKLITNGRKLVAEKYDWNIIVGRMNSIFQKL
ncbi:MAG: glycosyltransferase family 4 protein [Candidatus Doudnabacteria bacterium]|nr:glycosyltransferase family 4 protein [bacterium]MDZ4243818.1 glycosyltransferase family 4 protein [Candidatus Doudnabacteria bacterium]